MPRSQLVLSIVGGVVGFLFALGLYLKYGDSPRVSAQLYGYTVVSDREVSVRVRVVRDPGSATYCAVRGRDRSGTVVGGLNFDVPPSGARTQLLERSFPTDSRAVVGELLGCQRGTAPAEPSPTPAP